MENDDKSVVGRFLDINRDTNLFLAIIGFISWPRAIWNIVKWFLLPFVGFFVLFLLLPITDNLSDMHRGHESHFIASFRCWAGNDEVCKTLPPKPRKWNPDGTRNWNYK